MTSSPFWKDLTRPGSRTGYNGTFGDSFFSDCFSIVSNKKVITEDVASDVPENKVKPMYRRSLLSRLNSDDVYQVMLEVSHFAPSDLTVKLLNDKTVVVEGKHGEKKDQQGFISREFTRKYNLPESVKPSTIECFLSADEVLVIRGHADKPSSPFRDNITDNIIPIYTHGFHTQRESKEHSRTSTPSGDKHDQHERIIPITREETTEDVTPANAGACSSSSQTSNIGTDHHQKSSDRMTPDLQYGHSSHKRHHEERSVSFTDESNIDESEKTFSAATATNSKSNRTKTRPPSSAEVTIPISSSDENPGEIPEVEPYFVTSGRSSRASRSPINTPVFREEIHINPIPSTSKGTTRMDHGWKAHEINPRDRHFSTGSKSKDSILGGGTIRNFNDQDFFSSSRRPFGIGKDMERFYSPLMRERKDIFTDFGFPALWKDLPGELPVKSNEEQYEKYFEKGLNKDGHWEETFEEKFHLQKSSWYSSNEGHNKNEALMDTSQPHSNSNEHRINISSAA